MNLKPPAVPKPGIAEAPKTTTTASLISRDHCLRKRAMIAVSRSSGVCRLSKGSRMMNIEAKLELLACSRKDIPTKVTEWATPGVFPRIPATRVATSRVRSSDAESGS